MLRSLLVQDSDLDDDGRPETLRLLFATPRSWLEDGKTIKIERAPTAFGEVSLTVRSALNRGEVAANLSLPERNIPKHTLLRVRLPDGWKVNSANAGEQKLNADAQGTLNLSKLRGKAAVKLSVSR
jgi:hypothetical protein